MTETIEPNRQRPQRGSRSDSAFPGIWVVVSLVAVVALALLFVGYRVFEIESQRRAINEARSLLKGKGVAIAAERERRHRLAQLKSEVEDALGRLKDQETQTSGLEARAQKLQREIDIGEQRVRKSEEDSRKLRATADDIESKIENERVTAEGLERDRKKAESDLNRINDQVAQREEQRLSLGTQVAQREEQLRSLVTKVAQLEGKQKGIKDGAEVFQEAGHQLRQLIDDLTVQRDEIKKWSDDLAKTASQLEASSDSALGGLSDRIVDSGKAIDVEVASLQKSIEDHKAFSEQSREGLAKSQRELGTSANAIAQAASGIVPAGAELDRQVSAVAGVLERAKKQTDKASQTLDEASSNFSRSIAGHLQRLDKAEAELQNLVVKLEKTRAELDEQLSVWKNRNRLPEIESPPGPIPNDPN